MSGEIPIIRDIVETYSFERNDLSYHSGWFTFIAKDPNAGRRDVFSVIKVDYETGNLSVLGRELDIDLARRVALGNPKLRKDLP